MSAKMSTYPVGYLNPFNHDRQRVLAIAPGSKCALCGEPAIDSDDHVLVSCDGTDFVIALLCGRCRAAARNPNSLPTAVRIEATITWS